MSGRETIIDLIRNEYDPKPDLGNASYPAFDSEWDDGAGRIADAILAHQAMMLRKQDDLVKALEEIVLRGRRPIINTKDQYVYSPEAQIAFAALIRMKS